MRCSIMKVTLVIADVLLACGGGAAFTGTGGSGTQGFAGGCPFNNLFNLRYVFHS